MKTRFVRNKNWDFNETEQGSLKVAQNATATRCDKRQYTSHLAHKVTNVRKRTKRSRALNTLPTRKLEIHRQTWSLLFERLCESLLLHRTRRQRHFGIVTQKEKQNRRPLLFQYLPPICHSLWLFVVENLIVEIELKLRFYLSIIFQIYVLFWTTRISSCVCPTRRCAATSSPCDVGALRRSMCAAKSTCEASVAT
jgi:hypothetical protein